MTEYPKLLWRGEEECTVYSPEDQAAREKDGFTVTAQAPTTPSPNAGDAECRRSAPSAPMR